MKSDAIWGKLGGSPNHPIVKSLDCQMFRKCVCNVKIISNVNKNISVKYNIYIFIYEITKGFGIKNKISN